eukprot:CAMPEP_0176487818 /NCGR_PEP_ID=MMETSP0200_2-20121128/6355_1 /TAXON_ID=947934 /ORGANISM="Chaetoceros sp., Strain GSL56" /LENGTH=441 /DNA_ID=CAMNT_0017884713 /DNA_START=201 /DNA_END=1527 /DNA_ORIENTATION=-
MDSLKALSSPNNGDKNDGQIQLAVEQLSSALAKLDRQWRSKNGRRVSNRPTGGIAGWTKLILTLDNKGEKEEEEEKEQGRQQVQRQGPQEFVYLLEPPSTPSMILFFVGGAGLGQYPHIAYSEFLSRISKRLNAAIIAAPYPLGLDHFELSKKTGELLRRAVVQCEDEGGYSKTLPKFYLGHSLGSKLLGIALAATSGGGGGGGGLSDVNGIGFMSYNNFGFRDTLAMVKDFASQLNMGGGSMGTGVGAGAGVGVGVGMNGMNSAWNLDSILNLAGEAMSMMGIDFNPDPLTMDRIVEMKYKQELQKKTKLFIFDKDDLDSSQSFLDACQKNTAAAAAAATGNTANASTAPSVSNLKGNHLSPVYIKVSMDDLYSLDFPEEAIPFVTEASGGFQSVSFGEEEYMNGAVNEVCAWIMGKDDNGGKEDSRAAPRLFPAGTAEP